MKAILLIDVDDDENIEELRVSYKVDCCEEVLYSAHNETLKPMPRKRGDITLSSRTQQDINMVKWQLENKLVNKGWNDCIDVILGKEK